MGGLAARQTPHHHSQSAIPVDLDSESGEQVASETAGRVAGSCERDGEWVVRRERQDRRAFADDGCLDRQSWLQIRAP